MLGTHLCLTKLGMKAELQAPRLRLHRRGSPSASIAGKTTSGQEPVLSWACWNADLEVREGPSWASYLPESLQKEALPPHFHALSPHFASRETLGSSQPVRGRAQVTAGLDQGSHSLGPCVS